MRILYAITRSDAVGGASIHVRDLARHMQSAGHQVLVLTGGEGPVTSLLRAAGVPFLPLRFLCRSIRPWRDFQAFAEMARAIQMFRPDLVSLHTAKAGWLGRAACARLGIPALYTPHGWSIGGRLSRLGDPILGFAERVAARWAAAIICVCEFERRLALTRRIAPPERLRVILNGVHDIPPALLADPSQSPPRLISVARFQAPKDFQTLLLSLEALRAEPWELDLVGDGPLLPQLQTLAARLSLASRIRFLGYQPDPAEALSQAQIFVLSTRFEAFPRSILEALRAGLPVVATAVGGIPEAVEERVNGFLARPGDPASLASTLRPLLSDPLLRKQLGAAARRTYLERFRFERMARETQAAYDTVKEGTAGIPGCSP